MLLCTFAATTISKPFFETTGSETAGRRQAGRGDDRSKQAGIYDAPALTRRCKSKLAIVGEGYRWESRRRGVGSGLFSVGSWFRGRFVVVQSAASLWTCRSRVLPPAIPFRQFSGHSITTGSTVTDGRLSARPALPLLLWGVLPMALFGSSQCLGGVIRSRSPDSVLHPTASCTALSRHLTQRQRLAPLVNRHGVSRSPWLQFDPIRLCKAEGRRLVSPIRCRPVFPPKHPPLRVLRQAYPHDEIRSCYLHLLFLPSSRANLSKPARPESSS
jgi:hypothetical protein